MMNPKYAAMTDTTGIPAEGCTPETPLLSVVICTYNRCDLLARCLESLARQTAAPGTFELLVVDNNSTDATRVVAGSFSAAFTRFRVITETRQGLSNARNRGWQEACGAYVAYLDDDALASAGWVSGICDFIARRPEIGVFGGPFDAFFLAPPPAWFPPEYGSMDLGSEERAIRIGQEWIIGLNMVFRKELFLTAGGFDDRLGMNGTQTAFGEEINLFLSLHEKGEPIFYVPSIGVSHLVRPEKVQLRYLLASGYQSGRNHSLTFRVTRSLGEILLSLSVTAVKAAFKLLAGWRAPLKRQLYYALSPLAGELGALVEYFCRDGSGGGGEPRGGR